MGKVDAITHVGSSVEELVDLLLVALEAAEAHNLVVAYRAAQVARYLRWVFSLWTVGWEARARRAGMDVGLGWRWVSALSGGLPAVVLEVMMLLVASGIARADQPPGGCARAATGRRGLPDSDKTVAAFSVIGPTGPSPLRASACAHGVEPRW